MEREDLTLPVLVGTCCVRAAPADRRGNIAAFDNHAREQIAPRLGGSERRLDPLPS
jgi:hypothetical protein